PHAIPFARNIPQITSASDSYGVTVRLTIAERLLLDPRRDALREVEDAVRVVLPLHCREAAQVGAVVRVLPGREIGIDVVLVRETGDVGSHRRIETAVPVQVAGPGADPAREVL